VPPDALQQIETLLSNLTLYASLFAHGSGDRRTDYVARVAHVTTQLETVSARALANSP